MKFSRLFFLCLAGALCGGGFFPSLALATSVLDVSVADNNLYINSCRSQLEAFMGYKGYVDGVEIFTTGQFGGFPCFGGDLFFSNLTGFLAHYLPGPFHFSFDFYSSPDFTPPVFGHFNLYYDGSGFSPFDDSTHVVSFDISTSTKIASVHDYISAVDDGSTVNFNISTSTAGYFFTAGSITATTTGDFYYSWTFPELTLDGDYTFYTSIASSTSSVLNSTSTKVSFVKPKPTHSSVLFLPGVEASRLYKMRGVTCTVNCEDQLWEPNLNSDAEDLFMTAEGKSVDDSIYTRDVIDEAYGTLNIYKSFLNELKKMKTDGTIADYLAVPYDWRLSLEDILAGGKKISEESDAANISYLKSTSTPYILQELRRLVANSQNGKVTIVAHSNGGLLAKVILKKLADDNDPLLSKIDKLILVAVPQLGTPSAITALLHGYDQGIPFSISPILSNKTAQQLGQNLQSGYNLLPSSAYFTSVSTPVVTFDASSTPDWIVKYGNNIHSQDRLHNFLTDSYGRVASSSSDTDNPVSLRDNLLTSAEAEHVLLDSWTPPSTMQVIEIAGWGIPTTVSGAKYSKKDGKIKLQPTFTIDGDGTVVTPSALWTNGAANTTHYWVDLERYNFFPNRVRDGHLRQIRHADILEVPEFLDFVKNNLLTQNSITLQTFISTSTPTSESSVPKLIYSLHSPLTLDIYDNLGNHTGVSTTTGKIEEQIAGTYFLQFGDIKYIFTDTTTPINIVMSGYDSGTFTFTIEQKQGDNTVSTVTFQDIPTATTTKVTMSVTGDINTLSNLNVDSDNNGTTDITLVPIVGGTVTYTPPSSLSSASANQGGGSNGPPVVQIITTAVSTTSIEKASTTIIIATGSTGSTNSEQTSSPRVVSPQATTSAFAFQRSNLRNSLQGQTLGIKPRNKKKEPEVEKKNPNIDQTAQTISSNPRYFLSLISYLGSLFKKLVAIFKRN